MQTARTTAQTESALSEPHHPKKSSIHPADALFCNTHIHRRFRVYTDILGALVAQAPEALSMDDLQKRTGYLLRDLARHCSMLWQALLIAPAPNGGWRLMQSANQMSLDDVFQCVQANQNIELHAPDFNANREDIDRFLGQAALAVNQAITRELKQFSLARLRFDGTESVPFSPHFLVSTRYDAGPMSAESEDFPPLPTVPLNLLIP